MGINPQRMVGSRENQLYGSASGVYKPRRAGLDGAKRIPNCPPSKQLSTGFADPQWHETRIDQCSR